MSQLTKKNTFVRPTIISGRSVGPQNHTEHFGIQEPMKRWILEKIIRPLQVALEALMDKRKIRR